MFGAIYQHLEQLFQQSQVTTRLVNIFPYQTDSQPIPKGATTH